MTEQQNQQNAAHKAAGKCNPGQRSLPYLDHGEQSLVAMDNPDDSQLGADRTQSSDDGE
jgi:hypothetical protein